ncbi:unnamed protein product [Rotaria sp. Silwood1]|nr:unnamed protein product [Rotaria sp. Silwood1]
MSVKRESYLQILPIELVHRIFDYLNVETIVFSIRSLCKWFYSIANAYDCYKLDFRYMSKSDLLLMVRIIDPKNVISLILSDEKKSRNQIRFFLSHLRIDQFIRLRSLTLIDVKYEDLDEFQQHIMKYSLTTFSISPRYNGIDNIRLLSSIISCSDLRKFEFKGYDYILNGIKWPKSCRLEHMTICYEFNWRTFYSILNHLPHLRTLTNPITNYLFPNVTELTLMIDKQWPIDSIEHLSTILNLSNLQTLHLNFQCECKFAVNLDVEIDTLFKRACNLRSVQINCNDSERMKLITLNAICLKLPRHIKHLDTDITYVNDAKLILEGAEHLSNVTFRHSDAISTSNEHNHAHRASTTRAPSPVREIVINSVAAGLSYIQTHRAIEHQYEGVVSRSQLCSLLNYHRSLKLPDQVQNNG